MTRTDKGKHGEDSVYMWLRSVGIKTYRANYHAPFDLYTQAGTRIEVKTGEPRSLVKRGSKKVWGWKFNIHRHGNSRGHQYVDVYVLRLELNTGVFRQLGMGNACHLIIKRAEFDDILTVQCSVRMLMTKFARYFNDVAVIRDSDAAKTIEDRKDTLFRARPVDSFAASAAYDKLLDRYLPVG